MPSSTNNATNLMRNGSFPFRAAPGEYEDSSDIHNNSDTPKKGPSAFSKGLKGRPAPLESGQSDDSDLPRLSPIRTSSEPTLDNWEGKQKILPAPRENCLDGRCSLSRSSFYDGPLYGRPRGTLFVHPGRDSSDLSYYMGSHEESLTATSGAYSALSEDVWQNSPYSEQALPKINTHQQEGEDGQQDQQRNKSPFSTFFDTLTTTLNRGLCNLAITVERATSSAAREIASTMRSSSDVKSGTALFEVAQSLAQNEKEKKNSTEDSAVSTRIATGHESSVPVPSYDSSFNLCGGQDLYEELESLCNDYAKKLNKLRTRLSEEDKSKLDGLIERLWPIFDVVGSPSESDEDGPDQSVDDCLAYLYVPIDLFVGQSLASVGQKERSSVLEIANLVANPVNVLGSTSNIPMTPQTSRCAELYVELDSAVLHGKHSVELIHEEGVHQIAMLSMRCIHCLLELARERTLSPDSPRKLTWPSSSEAVGWLLRSFAIRLMHNIETVTGSFVGAILGLGNAYDENLQDGSVGQKAQSLAGDLDLDSGTAVMKIQESLRNLMYVVVYVTFES